METNLPIADEVFGKKHIWIVVFSKLCVLCANKKIVWILSLYFIDVNRNVHVNKRLADY